jgi:hypothetical protein
MGDAMVEESRVEESETEGGRSEAEFGNGRSEICFGKQRSKIAAAGNRRCVYGSADETFNCAQGARRQG